MPTSATLRLLPRIAWGPAEANAAPFDLRLLPLLAAIRRHATLRAAAAEAGFSYRAAWGLLADIGRQLGVPLVELRQGRGARLTEAGEQWLALHERVAERLREERFVLELRRPRRAPAPRGHRLALVASHDLLLAALCDQWARPEGVIGEVAFRGSAESLKALARGEADVAGFHTPAARERSTTLRRLLDPRRHAVLRFAEREQGLIVAAGNPKGLRSFADIARARARFVNRQRGSGTRLLIDQLLKQASLAPEDICGYESEEYTHLAVAATVATGQADTGFGLRAAAARFGLDFVLLERETYWLALRARRLETDPVRHLREALSGGPLRAAAAGLPGYSIANAGALTTL